MEDLKIGVSPNIAPGAHLWRHNRELSLIAIAVVLSIIGFVFLRRVGQFALSGQHYFQFFADSGTYHDMYSGFLNGPEGLVDVSYNFLGPMLLLSITGGNIYLVMITNIVIFTISMIFLSRALDIDPVRASIIQLINPMTLSSLMSVNKEIIAFPVIAFLITGYRYRSPALVGAAILVSVLARWQLTVFCLILIGIYFVRKVNRYITMLILLLSVSVAYYMSQEILQPVLENVEISTSSYTEGSGLFEFLIDRQNDGLYFLVAPLKAAHLLFSLGLRLDLMANPINIYNDLVVTTYCLGNILLFTWIVIKKQAVLSNDLIAISLVYLIVFALTPVYAPRYFFAVTVLWALVVAGARGGILPENRVPVSTGWRSLPRQGS